MSASETLSSSISIASSVSTLPPRASVAVLVKGPECRQEGTGLLAVEPARCQSVDLSDHHPSPNPQRSQLQVPVILQAMFRGRTTDEEFKHEEHELMEHSGFRAFCENASEQQLDVSHEYGYKYEFNNDPEMDGNCFQRAQDDEQEGSDADEDDEDDEDQLLDPAAYSPFGAPDFTNPTSPAAIAQSLLLRGTHATDGSCIHLLGKSYDPDMEYEAKRDDELSLFWFTYRCDFPTIVPYGITSDAGWGCMLRSAQMLLGQALRVHFKSRNWKSHRLSIAQRRREPFLRSLLTWMADFPSSADNLYSLHNMVAAGMSKYEILPGEWYGPQSACYVLRDLVHAHEVRQVAIWKRKKQLQEQEQQQEQQQQSKCTQKPKPVPDKPVRVFRVYVASQGTVYRDAIQELMTKESRAKYERDKREAQDAAGPKGVPDHPLATAEEDLKAEQKEQEDLQQLEWDTALLLLIPLRLGLNEINDDYAKSIAYTFSMPQSVGILGGRPRGARWFYGAWADGSKILGLDPHTVQNAPRKRTARVNGRPLSVVDISEQYLRSIHTSCQESVPLPRMDPSIALGFYCRSPEELQQLQDLMHGFKTANPNLPEIFSIAETSPDYEGGNTISSSVMDDLLGSGREGSSLLDTDDDEDTDDEYVML